MAIKQVTIGYHALIRASKEKGVLVGFPGDGPHVDVAAVPMRGHRVSSDAARDEPGEYALRGTSLAGDLFLSLLVAGTL